MRSINMRTKIIGPVRKAQHPSTIILAFAILVHAHTVFKPTQSAQPRP
jgi:hypothetical protein